MRYFTKIAERDIPGLLRSGYKWAHKDDPDRYGHLKAPRIKKVGKDWVVSLKKDSAMEHVTFLEDLFSGSQNVPNIKYEIDGIKHNYSYGLLTGPKLKKEAEVSLGQLLAILAGASGGAYLLPKAMKGIGLKNYIKAVNPEVRPGVELSAESLAGGLLGGAAANEILY